MRFPLERDFNVWFVILSKRYSSTDAQLGKDQFVMISGPANFPEAIFLPVTRIRKKHLVRKSLIEIVRNSRRVTAQNAMKSGEHVQVFCQVTR